MLRWFPKLNWKSSEVSEIIFPPEAKEAIAILKDLDITLYIKETTSWQENIPPSALSDKVLKGKLEKLEKLRDKLSGSKEVKKALMIDCNNLRVVENPMTMTKSPLVGESPEFFLRRIISGLKSTTDTLKNP